MKKIEDISKEPALYKEEYKILIEELIEELNNMLKKKRTIFSKNTNEKQIIFEKNMKKIISQKKWRRKVNLFIKRI